jgi:2-succinyl-5-enolpyruvyl-6-hydroxy-3-cyclohexene-1-carboxylate synthase
VDERSAAFAAIGVGRATGVPALVITTSGTAAAELHAAAAEAFHGLVPMILLTADRPPEMQGVAAPQTIDQTRLFGTAVRWFVEPGAPDFRDRELWRDLASDLFARSRGAVPGPVHANLAFREPLLGPLGEIPARRPTQDQPVTAPILAMIDEQAIPLAKAVSATRVVIIAGERAAVDAVEVTSVLDMAERHGWPVIADHLSNLRNGAAGVISSADALLRVPGCGERLRPDAVFRFGGLVASRFVNEWAATAPIQVGVDRNGVIPDPSRSLHQRYPMTPAVFLAELERVGVSAAPGEWAETWARLDQAATAAISGTLAGEPSVVHAAAKRVDDQLTLVVSSSMPIRDLEWYGPAVPAGRVLSNRGANGIDGVVSTAVGVALTGVSTIAVVGDLAFVHDSTALIGLRQRSVDLAILVNDNDGGAIFSFLPQAAALQDAEFETLFGTPHGTDLVALCAAHGIDSMTCTHHEVPAALDRWAQRGGLTVIVVRSDRSSNVARHARVHDSVAAVVAPLLDEADGVTTD